MMKKTLSLLMLFTAIFTSKAQTEISGVDVAERITIGGESLLLNGAGLREKLWIDLYVGSLYLETKMNNATKIMNDDSAMALKLHIVSKLVTSEKMSSAVTEGFEKSTNGDMTSLTKEIATFIDIFKKEPIVKGDIFDLLYKPETGVVVYKNGKIAGTIKGLEFKKALFGIWLCDRPADKGLKKAMLGS
ncbi:chalcone isomerase family protein [Sungkyunkwania multivorans]|uniref:Chalcone isomerase family protein n=1 Tax=Sungkyunkwania multivorans TaxID=1173618 RepID=A0ABW3CXC3_9FLAO